MTRQQVVPADRGRTTYRLRSGLADGDVYHPRRTDVSDERTTTVTEVQLWQN
jgi:hypothetical protein